MFEYRRNISNQKEKRRLCWPALKNLTVEEGQPVTLFFRPLPKDILASFEGCRFKSNGIQFASWRNGAESGTCQKPLICQRIEYQLNGSLPWMRIPRTTVNDSGHYSIECKSYGSAEAKDHGEEILLYVIKGNRTTHNPVSSVTPTEAKNVSLGNRTTHNPASSVTPTEAKNESEPANRSTSDDGAIVIVLAVSTVLVIPIIGIVVCCCCRTGRCRRRSKQWSPSQSVKDLQTKGLEGVQARSKVKTTEGPNTVMYLRPNMPSVSN